jgi:hypothetical protein
MNDESPVSGGLVLLAIVGATSNIDAVDAFYDKLFTWIIFPGIALWFLYWLIREFGPDLSLRYFVRQTNNHNAEAVGMLQALEKMNPGARNPKTPEEIELADRLAERVKRLARLKP